MNLRDYEELILFSFTIVSLNNLNSLLADSIWFLRSESVTYTLTSSECMNLILYLKVMQISQKTEPNVAILYNPISLLGCLIKILQHSS